MIQSGEQSNAVIEWVIQQIAELEDDLAMFDLALDRMKHDDRLRERTRELRVSTLEAKATAEKIIRDLRS